MRASTSDYRIPLRGWKQSLKRKSGIRREIEMGLCGLGRA